jgi:hypothetical protein
LFGDLGGCVVVVVVVVLVLVVVAAQVGCVVIRNCISVELAIVRSLFYSMSPRRLIRPLRCDPSKYTLN